MFNLMPWKNREQNDVTQFRREIDTLFDRFMENSFLPTQDFWRERSFPRIDVSEEKGSITVKAEVPGVDSKDIDLSVTGRILTIKGEKKQEKEEKGKNYHRIERSYGSFNRSVELPAEVDTSSVDASYKDGILTIEMKKTKESEVKKIEVRAG